MKALIWLHFPTCLFRFICGNNTWPAQLCRDTSSGKETVNVGNLNCLIATESHFQQCEKYKVKSEKKLKKTCTELAAPNENASLPVTTCLVAPLTLSPYHTDEGEQKKPFLFLYRLCQ